MPGGDAARGDPVRGVARVAALRQRSLPRELRAERAAGTARTCRHSGRRPCRELRCVAPRAGAFPARAGWLPSPGSAGDRLRRRPVRGRDVRCAGRSLPRPPRLRGGDSAPGRASSSPESSSPASGTWCAGAATARVPGASTRGRGSRCPLCSAPCAPSPTTRRPVRMGAPDVDAPPARWTPKLPEEILALTVCDPACGSGTFPLGCAAVSHRCAVRLAPAPPAHRARW